MENLRVRCRSCGKELDGYLNKTICCGCPNMTTIYGDKITANDLSQVVILSSLKPKNNQSTFSYEDMAWQESRRQRKIRKLDFEVR